MQQGWSAGGLPVKDVMLDAHGNVIWESDAYYSGRTITVDGQPHPEVLHLISEYGSRRRWAYLFTDNGRLRGMVGELGDHSRFGYGDADENKVLSAADDVLSAWGLSRL